MHHEIIKDDNYILANKVIVDAYATILRTCRRNLRATVDIKMEQIDDFQFLLGKREMSLFWYDRAGIEPVKCHQLISKLFKDLLVYKTGGQLE